VTLTIRRAVSDSDLDAIVGLRVEAERWLREHQIRQWTSDYADYARGVLRDSVDRGAAWVVEDDGQVIATVTINGPDPDFWGWADDQDEALYLGKMIVSRHRAGERIGDAIMNWASRQASRRGKRWIRLDCRRDNERLQSYYLDRGFTYVRTYHAPGRRTESGWLAQRPADHLMASPTEIIEPAESDGGDRAHC
jgi:predicted N-acetyltransferase YhbS